MALKGAGHKYDEYFGRARMSKDCRVRLRNYFNAAVEYTRFHGDMRGYSLVVEHFDKTLAKCTISGDVGLDGVKRRKRRK